MAVARVEFREGEARWYVATRQGVALVQHRRARDGEWTWTWVRYGGTDGAVRGGPVPDRAVPDWMRWVAEVVTAAREARAPDGGRFTGPVARRRAALFPGRPKVWCYVDRDGVALCGAP